MAETLERSSRRLGIYLLGQAIARQFGDLANGPGWYALIDILTEQNLRAEIRDAIGREWGALANGSTAGLTLWPIDISYEFVVGICRSFARMEASGIAAGARLDEYRL